MKNWIQKLSLSVGICLAVFTFGPSEAFAQIDTSIRKNFLVNTRGGFLFDNADENNDRKWEHDIWNSFLLSAGLYLTFPEQMRELYFFAGPEMSYMDNEEYISAAGRTSTLSTTYLQFWLTGGVTYRPAVLQTDWYFSGFVGVSPWGTVDTDIGGVGYTRSFKTKQPSIFNSSVNTVYAGASVCYDFYWEWSGCVAYEYRTASVATLGVNFGF